MARSTYIYVVVHKQHHGILATFTVKHECVAWLAKQELLNYDPSVWVVERHYDGMKSENRFGRVVDLPADTFLKVNLP
jgi:hypothetical protein